MLIDLLFPKFCINCGKSGKYFCKDCLKEIEIIKHGICPECNKSSIGGVVHKNCQKKYSLDGLVSLWVYSGIVKNGIKKFKYRFVKDLEIELKDLAKNGLMNIRKYKVWGDFITFLQLKPIIVPISLYWYRENWRGFNQSEVLAQMIGDLENLDVVNLLTRIKATKSQVKLGKRERKINLDRAFIVKDYSKIPKNVLLVDDVWTTGSTMKSACKVLKKSGAEKIWGFSFAR